MADTIKDFEKIHPTRTQSKPLVRKKASGLILGSFGTGRQITSRIDNFKRLDFWDKINSKREKYDFEE